MKGEWEAAGCGTANWFGTCTKYHRILLHPNRNSLYNVLPKAENVDCEVDVSTYRYAVQERIVASL